VLDRGDGLRGVDDGDALKALQRQQVVVAGDDEIGAGLECAGSTRTARGARRALNRLRIVASIEEPTAIRAILAHFAKHGALEQAHYRPAARAPPAAAA